MRLKDEKELSSTGSKKKAEGIIKDEEFTSARDVLQEENTDYNEALPS